MTQIVASFFYCEPFVTQHAFKQCHEIINQNIWSLPTGVKWPKKSQMEEMFGGWMFGEQRAWPLSPKPTHTFHPSNTFSRNQLLDALVFRRIASLCFW